METGLPLRARKRDYFFVVAFALFTCTSIFSDAFHALGVTGGPFGDANALYADLAGDEFFASNPLPLRVRLYFSAFVFGPVTLALMIGFLRGWNRIRPLALMYAGAMIIGVLEFFAWEWASGAPATRPAVLVAFNGPYLLVPVLLAVRMWRDEPFGRVETSTE